MIDFDSLPARVRFCIEEAARANSVTAWDILGASRLRDIAHARQEAMARCRAMCWRWSANRWGRPSFPQIGKWFDRDHTTVIHACREVEKRRLAAEEANHG